MYMCVRSEQREKMKKKNINLKRHNDNDDGGDEFGEKYVSTKWYNEVSVRNTL